MKLFRIAALVVLAAATVAARSAGAAPSSGATSFHAAAGAAHTDATHRHAHRRAHRTLARYTTSAPAWPVATRPFPYRPTHPRREHRADMPRAHRLGRSHGDPRTGSRLMATLPGQTALMATTVTRLDLLQNEGMTTVGGFEFSGRGPPRASPLTDLPPSLAAGLPKLPPPAAPLSSTSRSIPSTPGDFACLARARAGAGSAPVSKLYLEPPTSCSHADRPEGAAA